MVRLTFEKVCAREVHNVISTLSRPLNTQKTCTSAFRAHTLHDIISTLSRPSNTQKTSASAFRAHALHNANRRDFSRRTHCTENESLLNLRRRTVNLRRPERARNEGSRGPKRLDDTRCTTYKRRRCYKYCTSRADAVSGGTGVPFS